MNILAVYAWVTSHWQEILAAVGSLHVFLGVLNKLFVKAGSEPSWWKTVLDLTGALAQRGATGAMMGYSPLGMRSRPMMTGVPPAALLIPLVFLINSCGYCRVAANYNTARCKAERVVTNCGEPAVASVVSGIVGDVLKALASANYAAAMAGIEADLIKQGEQNAWGVLTCAVNQAENMITLRGMFFYAENYSDIRDHAEAWKHLHPATVK